MSAGHPPSQSPKLGLWQRLQQRLEHQSLPQTEDSVALRVLVQALVAVGILSVTVASAGVTDTSLFNIWAIPFSMVGATWSWYRRRSRNVAVKFCIAIGMLVALGVFFVRMTSGLSDTRILLAELLIHLQVLHSFDLPRRKDLGYSIVIGLVLISVAATISQTLTFAPLLIIFLALALPVLVLDYRSRLNLLTQGWKPLWSGLSWRRLTLVLLVTMGLGLAIFAILPRVPGYQLRTFPVSADIEYEGDFDGRSVTNPGYVQDGSDQGEGSAGFDQDASEGPGVIDNRFFYGFNRRINQNLRGELIPQVLMRVRSQAAGFWRVLAFDQYTGQGWDISRNESAETLNRSTWSYRFTLPTLPTMVRDHEVIQTYTIVSEFSNLIPALYQPEQVYFPTKEIAVDPEGSMRSPLLLTEGLTYTVVSEVPERRRALLRQSSTNYSSTTQRYYLQIPEEIQPRVRQRTLELLAQSEKPITEPYEQALYLAQALKQQYQILPEMPFLTQDEDLVEAFLFKYEGGYPDHFATTLTIMLRSIGIPARLAMGFSPGEFNPFTGFYIVKNTDAHAVTEVYFPRYGWFAFDAIPGHEVIPPSFEDYEAFSVIRQFWRWVAGWLPSPITGFVSGLFTVIGNALSRLIQLFSQGWTGILLGLASLLGLGFLGWLLWSLVQVWRDRAGLAKMPPMERLYQQMVRSLAERGFAKSPSQTPLEYARQANGHVNAEQANVIEEITQVYLQWRYGDQHPDLDHVRQRLKLLKKRSPQLQDSRR
jgi:transglutaminase-like putative cysteine protease